MKRFCILMSLLALGACGGTDLPNAATRATVNLDYASTSLGYRNSGALSSGRLMLWDTAADELVTLQSDIPLGNRAPTPPVRLEATSVRGASISGSVDLPKTVNTRIATELRNNLTFSISDAVRINATGVYSGISQAYRDLIDEGVNAFSAWRVADVTGQPSRYKYVLVTDEIRASDELLALDKSFSSDASFSIVDTVEGEVKVIIPASNTAKCSGAGVICYVNVSVLKVFLNDDGNLDYSPASFNSEKLVKALRSLS